MRHRFDLHVHSYYSADASSAPEALIAAARARGLSGIAITDHNSCRATTHCLEAGLMREDGLPVDGFLLVPGVEVSTAEGHLLCLGVTLPNMIGVPAADVEREVRARGGVAIPAHPFDRWRAGIPDRVMDRLETRVIEGFNAAVTSRSYNTLAKEYARRRGKAVTAGSDAHYASAVGFASTAYGLESLSLETLLQAIPSGGECEENYLTRWGGVKKHFGNWFRIFNPSLRPVAEPE